MSILVSFADFERSIRIERSKDSYLRRLKNGISSGVLTFSYKREEGKILVVSEQAKSKTTLRLSTSKKSMQDIARKTEISKDSVRYILSNIQGNTRQLYLMKKKGSSRYQEK